MQVKSTNRQIVASALAALTLGYLSFVSQPAKANLVGVGTQNFNPVTDGLDFVTVHSSKTLKPGVFNFGAFLNYGVNTLPYVDTGVQSRTELNDSLTSSDLSVGVGILKNLSIGMSLPAVLNQTVERRAGVRGDFSANGSTEIRFNTKYRFVGEDKGGLAAVGSLNLQRTQNDPFAGQNAGPTYNLELVYDRELNRRVTAAVNIGYRLRDPGTPIAGTLIEPMRDQWIASAAASYLIEESDTKVIAEVFAAFPAQEQGINPTRNLTSAELLLGLKQDVSQTLALHIGGGTELIQGVSSPDWRVYTGLNYTFGPVWGESAPIVQRVSTAPEVVPVAAASVVERFTIGSILFKFDSSEMIQGYPKILAGLVEQLKRQNFKSLSIEGYTDSMGKADYNFNLSLRRANAIRDYLINVEKIDGAKISAAGYGPTRPIANNGNYQGRQENRRVEFVISR